MTVLIELLRNEGVVVWGILLYFAYRRLPRALPYAIRLGQVAIGVAALTLPAGVYGAIFNWPAWNRSIVSGALYLVALISLAAGLLLAGAAIIVDARQRPSDT